jgi:hypothetical protein
MGEVLNEGPANARLDLVGGPLPFEQCGGDGGSGFGLRREIHDEYIHAFWVATRGVDVQSG